jgi:hypothetical protein
MLYHSRQYQAVHNYGVGACSLDGVQRNPGQSELSSRITFFSLPRLFFLVPTLCVGTHRVRR